MVKVLHCADFHLDTPFAANEEAKARARRQGLRDTFVCACDTALSKNADLLLIAGDLFDRNFITDDTAKLIVAQFSRLKGKCRVIITPGNHDPYQEGSPYQKLNFPDNVFVFTETTLSYLEFSDLNCRVYGYAFHDHNLAAFPLADFTPDPDWKGLSILCAHTEYDLSASQKAPIMARDLEKSGFDYAAFGHIHKYTGMQKIGRTHYCYCGSADGLDFGECGKKNFLFVTLQNATQQDSFSYEEIPSSPRHYEVMPLDLSGAHHNLDAIAPLQEAIQAAGYDENTALRVILRGNVSPDFYFSERALLPYFENLLHLEIKNETNPFYDCTELEADIGIRGALYRQLKDKLHSDDPADRALAQSALQFGLCALAGNELPTSELTDVAVDAE